MGKLKWLLLIAAFLAVPLAANAGIIGNVNLTEYYSDPTGYVTFPSGYGNYYLDYDASINGAAAVEAFCVEDQNGPPSTMQYTLLTIDSGLSSFGLSAAQIQNYLAIAWIADYYYANYEGKATEEAGKASAQTAVWEVFFDGIAGFDLTAGGFKSSNPYAAGANTIWSLKPALFPTSNYNWALAVNPTVLAGGDIGNAPYQNYIVHYPTPIPGAIWLLGSGLLGLVAVRRRRK